MRTLISTGRKRVMMSDFFSIFYILLSFFTFGILVVIWWVSLLISSIARAHTELRLQYTYSDLFKAFYLDYISLQWNQYMLHALPYCISC